MAAKKPENIAVIILIAMTVRAVPERLTALANYHGAILILFAALAAVVIRLLLNALAAIEMGRDVITIQIIPAVI